MIKKKSNIYGKKILVGGVSIFLEYHIYQNLLEDGNEVCFDNFFSNRKENIKYL